MRKVEAYTIISSFCYLLFIFLLALTYKGKLPLNSLVMSIAGSSYFTAIISGITALVMYIRLKVGRCSDIAKMPKLKTIWVILISIVSMVNGVVGIFMIVTIL
jgi:uncharacterized membrane protein